MSEEENLWKLEQSSGIFLELYHCCTVFPHLANSPRLVVGSSEGMSRQGDLESSSVILRLSSSSVFSVSLRVQQEYS